MVGKWIPIYNAVFGSGLISYMEFYLDLMLYIWNALFGAELKARCRRSNPAECRGRARPPPARFPAPGVTSVPRPHGQPSRRKTDGGRTGENGGATRFLSGGMADAKAQPKRRKPAPQVSLYGSAPPARLPAKGTAMRMWMLPRKRCAVSTCWANMLNYICFSEAYGAGKTLTGSSPGSWWTPAHVPAARGACARNGAARLQARVAAG